MLDVELLKDTMRAYGDSITALAEALGVSRQNVSQVLHGVHDFTYPQMCVIVHRYTLTSDEVYDIFFKKKEGDVLPPLDPLLCAMISHLLEVSKRKIKKKAAGFCSLPPLSFIQIPHRAWLQ